MTARAQLLTSAESWLMNRDDISTGDLSADTLVLLTEAEIGREVRVRDMETELQLVCTSRNTSFPDDFAGARSITVNSSLERDATYLTPERIRTAGIWQNQGGARSGEGLGTAYTIIGNDLVVAPEPSAGTPVTFDVIYYAKYPPLVNPTDTNWLLQNAFDVWLWQVCYQVGLAIEDDALASKYKSRFDEAVAKLHRSEQRTRFSGSALIATGNPRKVV